MLATGIGLRSDRGRRRSRLRCVLFVAGVLVLFAVGVVVPAGAGATGVYVSNSSSNSVSVFGIGAGGVLAPVACDPTTICKTGSGPLGVAVDPVSYTHLLRVKIRATDPASGSSVKFLDY